MNFNTSWKVKYHEKNNKESHLNIFRNLEIENYLKQSLKKKNFELHNYKFNISNTRITFFLSVYEYEKQRDIKQNSKKKKLNFSQRFGENSFKSLKRLTEGQFHLVFKIKVINSSFLNKTVKKSLQNQSEKLRIYEMRRLYLMLTTQKNATDLLGIFIAKQLKITKKHNLFLNVLTNCLTQVVKLKHSKIKGIKILLKGRLNNAPRSQNKIIKSGIIPITTQNVRIHYSETTSFTSNGTIGIKIWVNQ